MKKHMLVAVFIFLSNNTMSQVVFPIHIQGILFTKAVFSVTPTVETTIEPYYEDHTKIGHIFLAETIFIRDSCGRKIPAHKEFKCFVGRHVSGGTNQNFGLKERPYLERGQYAQIVTPIEGRSDKQGRRWCVVGIEVYKSCFSWSICSFEPRILTKNTVFIELVPE